MLKKLEEGTYYIVDLIGLEVYTDEEELLGKVDYIYNTGSSDIYVVKNERRQRNSIASNQRCTKTSRFRK